MTKKLIVLLMAVLLLNKYDLAAQVSNKYLTLGKSTVSIDGLVIADSIGFGNSKVHTAEFDIVLNGTSEIKLVLSELLATCIQRNKIAVMVLSSVNTNLEVVEERIWKNVTISQAVLPELAGAPRIIAKIRIKISAETAAVKYDSKTKISLSKTELSEALLTADCRLKVGRLQSHRFANISSMVIGVNSGEPITFHFELVVGESKDWVNWFINGAGGIKKEQGILELHAPDRGRTIMEINLGDLEIISYSTSYSSNQQGFQRVTIGLRTQSISISSVK